MADKFVLPAVLPDGKVKGGLTIREYFAVMAMQGLIASGAEVATTKTIHAHRNQKLAQRSVEVADSLIAQLERTV